MRVGPWIGPECCKSSGELFGHWLKELSEASCQRKVLVRLPVISLLLGMLLIPTLGCRSLRTSRHTRNLTDARQLSLRGAGLLQQENYGEAETLFVEALKHSSADERAHWGMAEVLWSQGSQGQAIEHMSQAADLSGQNPDLLVRLGEMHLANQSLDEALAQAELALSIHRQHAEAWALKGQVLREQERFEEAMDCYQRALIYNPADSSVRVAVADIHYALGQPQRALATLDRLADKQPTEAVSARAWMLRGQALADLGESGEAKDCLRQAALCALEEDFELLLELAQIQYETGDLAEARICLGRALRDHPNDPNALILQNVLDRSFSEFSKQTPVTAVSARRRQDGQLNP